MKAVGVLPARWASTRLPGKVLVPIAGKPMLQRVWERVRDCRSLDRLIIACDEPHVFESARAFGAEAVMTRRDHPSGSDRVAEVVRGLDAGIVVNIQADEPLIDPALVDALVERLTATPTAVMSTPVSRFRSYQEVLDPNAVKAVLDKNGYALYFSRAVIPFRRDGEPGDPSRFFRHLGLYAYRREFLLDFCSWPKSFLESEECLEQLRVLESGYRILCLETSTVSVGVDTPEDVRRVEKLILEGAACR